MGLFNRFRRRAVPEADPADLEHLRAWAAARTGVEAFLEPQTLVNVSSVCLVAADGEWTRRDVGTPQAAVELCRGVGVPLVDVEASGYPERMREYTRVRHLRARRERAERLRALRDEDSS